MDALNEVPPEREEPKDEELPKEPVLPNEGCATLDPGGEKLRDIEEEPLGVAPLRAKLFDGEFVLPRMDELGELGPREELPEPKECHPPSLRAEVDGELKPRAAEELLEKPL